MEYIRNFNEYGDDLIVEKLNLQPLLDTFKNTIHKSNIANMLIGSLLTLMTITQVVQFIQNRSDLNSNDKKTLIETVSKFKEPLNMNLSDNGLSHIKDHEKLKSKAYTIGDGRITIGYGHAEPIKKSNFKIGQVISNELADKLLAQDIKDAEDGVKRIFKEWRQKGIHIKLTQGQFDTMVSLAFNMGVTSLRTSDFIQSLKHKDLIKAAEQIKTTGISDEFPGLAKRRISEYNMFTS